MLRIKQGNIFLSVLSIHWSAGGMGLDAKWVLVGSEEAQGGMRTVECMT